MARKKTAVKEQAASSGDTVFVALNRPVGIQFSMPDGRKVIIAGNGDHLRGQEKGVLPIGAYGLTRIAAADWEWIQKTYAGMEIFKNGLIFAQGSKGDAMAEADERKGLRHGLEPVEVKEGAAGQKLGEVRAMSAGEA